METIRTQGEVAAKSIGIVSPTICPVQLTQPRRWKRQRAKAKEKAKAAIERRQARVSNENGPWRVWLGDLTSGMLPDDGLYIDRSKSVPGGQQGWGNPWKVNDASLHSHQKVFENYGKMTSSPSERWLRWHPHEVRSKVLYCHCRESQARHGDVIARAFAEAMSEELYHVSRASDSAKWDGR